MQNLYANFLHSIYVTFLCYSIVHILYVRTQIAEKMSSIKWWFHRRWWWNAIHREITFSLIFLYNFFYSMFMNAKSLFIFLTVKSSSSSKEWTYFRAFWITSWVQTFLFFPLLYSSLWNFFYSLARNSFEWMRVYLNG